LLLEAVAKILGLFDFANFLAKILSFFLPLFVAYFFSLLSSLPLTFCAKRLQM
jgi:hypothetical protein